MSLTPQKPAENVDLDGITAPPVPDERPSHNLRRRLWNILFALLAFEIGAFLLIFPWLDAWSFNHLPRLLPPQIDLQELWNDPYFRSAISGLGAYNLYISLAVVSQLIHQKHTSTA